MFERKNRDKPAPVVEKEPIPETTDAELDNMVAEIEAAEGGQPAFTNHKYQRQNAGGWTCGHCKKHITQPGLILEKSCPQA